VIADRLAIGSALFCTVMVALVLAAIAKFAGVL